MWQWIEHEPSARGFTLVRGAALSIHLDHRISEDLDLVWGSSLKLPREQIDALLAKAAQSGMSFERDDDDRAFDEFEIGGMDLHDLQQDFIVNNAVRLSFFCGDSATKKILKNKIDSENLVVAAVSDLFAMKALILSLRTKTRDWFDLYFLLKSGAFTIEDYYSVYQKFGKVSECDSALAKIISGSVPDSDEGFSDLLENPPSISEMISFFAEQRDHLEQWVAKEFKNSATPS